MNFIINNFLYLKLFLWWNFIIKKNEFHPNLDIFFVFDNYKNLKTKEASEIVMQQRDIAHLLDIDNSIRKININKIKKARIKLFSKQKNSKTIHINKSYKEKKCM